MSAASALVMLLAFAALRRYPGLAPIDGPLLALALVAIPVGLAGLLLQNLLIGTLQVHAYNVIDFVTRILAVLLIAATVRWGAVSPEIVYALGLSATGLGAVWAFAKLRSTAGGRTRPHLDGGVGGAGSTTAFGPTSGAFSPFWSSSRTWCSSSTCAEQRRRGYYSIAVAIADLLLMLPAVLGTILFPRLGAAPGLSDRWRLTRRVLKVVVPATPLALLAVLLAAKPLIRLAYGPAFDPSFPAVAWLLPGIGFLAINILLMNFFASCGMPWVTVYSPLVALLVNVLLNLALVPRLGFAEHPPLPASPTASCSS